MTDDEFRELHDQIAAFDDIEWIAGDTREFVERFMPDLVDKLPDRRTKTFDQAFGRTRPAAVRKHPKRIRKSAMKRPR